MIINRWNYKKHNYEKVEVNGYWNCKTYSDDMEEIINCPNCGKAIKFKDGYTSMEWHTDFGIGFTVCSECHEKEYKRRIENDFN